MVVMRPKLIALIAVPVFALVGCSASATPEPDPVESSTPSASPAPAAKKAVAKKAADKTPRNEAGYLEALDASLTAKKDQIPGNLQDRVNHEYYLERGDYYCSRENARKAEDHTASYETGDEKYFETMILMQAASYLCPSS